MPGKPVAARGLVNGWMALAPDGMERSGRFSRYHLPPPVRNGRVEGAWEGVESDLGGASCYYTFHPLPRTGASVRVLIMDYIPKARPREA